MKRLTMMVTMLALSIMVAAPLTGHAVEKKAKSEVVMKMGNKLHLFHSGKVDAQKEITIGDVITVYRELGKNRQQKEVGQVKVLSFIGEHYFEAEIVKGEIKIGDIAKKDATSLLVQPAK
ncbi:hypothetical protein KI809_02050 [Geobacter pelophilus]|uniref:Uncharacterized protein n=1 Tax=Geoanaerobacter pelophilus TaxID=60036 RepID=A0AAW4L363_9BACT|nr:hypothetical protein [Geoanaerobacter pelophilus]MBT0663070.1 hypothetical protein [Geoanaerobacter pelophilus]